MYGYQGNNSQTYNYQNTNGSSYGNIGQYPGHYSYYSNASTAYNAFPSNDQPCSSLGVLPQEYSQVGNGIPRPYYFDSNNGYPRPYQALPYNQSMELPTATSYNSCPRNCRCCDSINPKYFATNNSLQQQTNTQNICDSSLNATYNSFRKGLSSGRWRESNSQLSNIHDMNESSSSWPIPKYGTSCKSEPCMWPLSHKQPTKFENTEHLATSNAYMLPQQHQRKPLTSNQTYSVLHSNSLLPVQTSRPPQGRNEDLMGNCFTGYPCAPDYKKNIAEHAPYAKPHISKITSTSRPTCNLSSNCEGGFPYKFSTPNSNVYHENQKCAIDSSKLVSQLPSTLVESIHRRIPGSNLLDGANEMSYCQPGMISSVHSIDAPSRRSYSIPTEGETRILHNCGSSVTSDALPASRLQLPPIHSIKPSGIVMNGQPKDFCDDFPYNPPRISSKGSLDSSYRLPSARTLSNVSVRNLNAVNLEKVPEISSENTCRMQAEMGNGITLTNFMPNSRFAGKQFYSEPSSEFTEVDSKLTICKDMSVKPISSMSGNPVIGDLRHFLSTWDDGDDEENNPVTPCALPLGNTCIQEQLVKDINLQECASVDHLQEKRDNACTNVCGNLSNYVEPKEVPVSNATYECANSYKVFNSNSFNVHSNSIVGIDDTVVGDIGIPSKSCGESKHCEEQSVIKSNVNALCSDAEQEPQGAYHQLGLGPQNNLNLDVIGTNISEKSESRVTRVENLNIPTKSDKGRGKASALPSGKEKEVNMEILNYSTSYVVPSGVVSVMSAEESQGDVLQNAFDGNMGNREELSCIRSVERRIPESKDSESPNKLPKDSSENNPMHEVVGSIAISSSLSSLPESTNTLNETLSSDHSPGNYLSSERPEYPDNLIWYNSESKEYTFDPKNDMVGNHLKAVKEKHVKTKEMENGPTVNDKTIMDQDLRPDGKYHDVYSENGKHELGIKESIQKDNSCNSDVDENVIIPIAELNGVHSEKNISNYPLEEVVATVKEDKDASHTENIISLSHLEKTGHENLLNGEACVSPQKEVFGRIFNYHEYNQEQGKLEIVNSLQSTEIQVHEMVRDSKKLFLNQCEEIASKSTRLKNKVRSKESPVEPFRKVPKKASCIAALLLRRKYQMMRQKDQKRTKLGGRGNRKDGAWISTGMSMIENRKNMQSIEKKCDENYLENQSCKRNSPNGIDMKEHQIICCENKNELSVASDTDDGRGNLKDNDNLKNEDDELQKTHSMHSGNTRLLGEGNAVDGSESEIANENFSGANVGALLSLEEREAQSINFEGSCIIGNVEVFMGTVEEANSFEEAIGGADMENTLHKEPSIQEEASNIQYWCNYELGNDLGVAMEIEVGSEIYSADSVELKQQVEEGILALNGMSEIIADGAKGKIYEHQGKEKVLVKHTDDLNVVKTVNGISERSTMNEDCFSDKVVDNQDTFICKQTQNIENGVVNFNNNFTCSLTDRHPEKSSFVQRSIIEDNLNQNVDTFSKDIAAEGDDISNCSQEVKGLGVCIFPKSYSANDTNDYIMPEITCAHGHSEEVEPSNQENKQHITSGKSTPKMTSLKTKDNTFHKRFKKCIKQMSNSAFSSNGKDLIKSHSTNQKYSNSKLQTGRKSMVVNAAPSNQIHSEYDHKSSRMPSYDSANNPEKGELVMILKKDVSCKDGTLDQVGSIEINECDSSKLVSLKNDKSCKIKLSTTCCQSQINLKLKNRERHSSSHTKAKSHHHHRGSDKIFRNQSVKLKYVHKSSTIKNPMKVSGTIIQLQELPNKASVIKTKASLKSFDNILLKSVKCPKFDFWKNRSWHHKRIFGQNSKKSTTLKNVNIPHRVKPQPSKDTLPQILQICSSPPPKPLSPLPVLRDPVDPIAENASTDVFQSSFEMKPLEMNINENIVFPSSCSSLGMKKYSSNSASTCLYPSQSEPKFSSSHEGVSFCQATPEMDFMADNLEPSEPFSAIHSITHSEQKITPQEVIKCGIQNEKDAITDSPFLDSNPAKDSTPHIPEETKTDSSWSMMNSSLVNMESSSGESPHVRISFKKVLNGSKKNLWMKRPVTDNPVKNQDIFPKRESKTIKRMISSECESPLPKVTIKKKSGERGYQSFLSGFSSASSSPSTSPTFQPKSSSPLHMMENTEKSLIVKCNDDLRESTTEEKEPAEELHGSLDSTRVIESHDAQDVEIPAENSSTKRTFYTNVVEKKEGSGLVFVIRALGSKIKECSIKDKDIEYKHPSPSKDLDLTNSNTQDTSSCAAGVGDDYWESGPWSVWQPVVKLFRSCELDHLALKLNSVHEDSEGKNTHNELHNSQESSRSEECPTILGNELPSNPIHHSSQDKTKETGQKGKTISESVPCKNQYGEIILNRKGSHVDFGTNKVEFDKVMRECDRLNLPKKKPKSGNKFQSAHKPTTGKDTHILNTASCNARGKVLDRKERVSTEQGTNKLSVDASSVKGQLGWTEKNECYSESETNSYILSKGKPLNEKIKKEGERTWENIVLGNHNGGNKQGTKAVKKIESEGGASDGESVVKLTNSKILSSSGVKSLHIPSKHVPIKGWVGKVKHKMAVDNHGPEEASYIGQEPVKEELQSKSRKCEEESHAEPTNRSPYACEACGRTFSSQKWLSRHCRGVSHSRVENAQRQAVQALLLLFTGNESHLLQRLTEKELSHLKRWSSHAVPSPLQLALKEFLNPT